MTDGAGDEGLHILNTMQVAHWLEVIKCKPIFWSNLRSAAIKLAVSGKYIYCARIPFFNVGLSHVLASLVL